MTEKENQLKIEDRVAKHRRMAESYRDAYLNPGAHDGKSYEEWKFADNAVYASPYFTGDKVIQIPNYSIGAAKSTAMEVTAYSIKFPDWKPVDFKYWPADNGFALKTRWEGHTKDGTKMGFYSYSFVETNQRGEITRWETHNNEEYGDFLEVAIGVRGPFKSNLEYREALQRCLDESGVSV